MSDLIYDDIRSSEMSFYYIQNGLFSYPYDIMLDMSVFGRNISLFNCFFVTLLGWKPGG